jgi:hypothetical protein
VNLVKIIFAFLLAILRTLLYGWIVGLWRVFLTLWERCRRACAKHRLPGRQGKASPKDCVTISDPAMNRPDPLIYDQYYLMSLGFAVTWDNPDIWLELGGVIVPSEQLQPNTTYDVVARIWNGSTEGVVARLPVHFSYLSFGAGIHSNKVLPGPDLVKVDLGVKGGPQCPVFARTKWTTPAAGHYCLQVSFSCIDDSNPDNNLGQENTQVGTSHSPVAFQFQLRNAKRFAQGFHFEADTYTIPPLSPCGSNGNWTSNQTHGALRGTLTQRPYDVIKVPPQHDRRNYPLPAGWIIAFAPPNPQLLAGAEITVVATVTPPAGFTGRQPINVHAFGESGLAGGITLYLEGS